MSNLVMDISLHNHLDGSYPMLSVLPELWRLTHGRSKPYPFNPWSNHHNQIKSWFNNPLKGDIVKKFSITTGVMQDMDTLYIAAKNFVEMRARQGFKYCEMIIAPQYHVFLGLSVKQVIGALIRGIKRAEMSYPGIEACLVLGIGREVSPEKAVELILEFGECEDREYIAGMTLVCDEAKNPPEKHKGAFSIAKILRFKTACHTGEWVHDPDNQEPDLHKDMPLLLKNCWTAVSELKVDRLEHARPLAYSIDLMKVVKDRNIGITSCPGSYACSGLLPNNDFKVLKLSDSLDFNLLITLDSDDDLFMDDINDVLAKCNQAYKFNDEQRLKLRLNAWKMRFGRRKPIPEDIVL